MNLPMTDCAQDVGGCMSAGKHGIDARVPGNASEAKKLTFWQDPLIWPLGSRKHWRLVLVLEGRPGSLQPAMRQKLACVCSTHHGALPECLKCGVYTCPRLMMHAAFVSIGRERPPPAEMRRS